MRPFLKTSQLITSKYTIISSNVGAVLLTCVTIKFDLTARETAEAVTDTDFGTAACLLGTLVSIFCWCFFEDPLLREEGGRKKIVDLGKKHNVKFKFYMFILSCLTFMCLIPGLSLEVAEFTYKGVMEDFVDEKTRRCNFWDFGINLWDYTPSTAYALLFSGCYWLNNVLFPLLTYILASLHYFTSFHVPSKLYKLSFAMSMLDGVLIAVGFSVLQIEMVSRWIFDDR